MTRSNTKLLMLKLVGAILVAASFTACVKKQKGANFFEDPKRKDTFTLRTDRNGDVVNLNLSGYDPNLLRSGNVDFDAPHDVELMSQDARFTSRREYPMHLCGLQDMREGGTPLLGQKFNVYSEVEISTKDVVVSRNKQQANSQIESDSCIYWTVSLPYAHFAKSFNLAVNLFFVSTSGQKTYIHKTILLNPWEKDRKGNPETFDYTRYGLTQALRNLPWAEGYDKIMLALEGKLEPDNKKLEIGSVAVQALNKNCLPGDWEKLKPEDKANPPVCEQIQDDMYKQYQDMINKGKKPEDLAQAMNMQLNIELKNLGVRVFDAVGHSSLESITSGRYRIMAQLFVMDSDYKGYKILTRPMFASDERNWRADELGVKAVLPFAVTMRPTYGHLKLALRVIPVDLPLQPYDALLDIGEFNQLSGAHSPLYALNEYSLQDGSLVFDYKKFLEGASNHDKWEGGFPELDITDGTLQKGFPKFRFTTLNVKFNRIMPGDTATDRTIQYTVNTCVIDNVTGGRPEGLKFHIRTQDRGHDFFIDRQVDDTGCLSWVGMISHKYYQREQLIPMFSELTYMGEDDKGHKYKLDYYINPWDEKFGTFGNDARNIPPEYLADIAKQQETAPATRLLITDFRYDATGFRYAIDRYMNMTVKKTVLMNIHPKMLKYNSIISGRSGTSDLRDGIYLLKIAMQKDYLDPSARGRAIKQDKTGRFFVESNDSTVEKKQFLTIREMLVRVLGGYIITPIEFDIKDLRTLRIRSQMFLQLETIDEMLLRVAALHSKLVHDLKDGDRLSLDALKELPEYKPIIISLEATEDEINRIMNDFKDRMDDAMVKQIIAELETKRAQDLAKLKELFGQLDEATLKAVYEHYDLMARMNQTSESGDGNLLYANTNALIQTLRNDIQSFNAGQYAEDTIDFATDQGKSCQAKYDDLKAKNDPRYILYNPQPLKEPMNSTDEGALCFKALTLEQLYYQNVDNNPYLADKHLRSLFGDTYSIYIQNLLPDDLSNPNIPNYDFSALSNQGDERAKDARPDASGLPRRTFIGPVTFVLNGNGSAMRPTDALDEKHCNNTCAMVPIELGMRANSDEVQRVLKDEKIVHDFSLSPNSAYEKSPYYGSVMHFYNKQVEDLIPMDRGLTLEYHEEMKAFSLLGNLADQLMLDYVSFAPNPAPLKKLDYNCYLNWKVKMEEVYKKWRDGTDLSFQTTPIPDSCYVASSRALPKQKFMEFASDNKQTENEFVNKKQLNALNLPVVSEAQYREFSKNGLVSNSLDMETKFNILHRMCFMLRKNFIKDPSKYADVHWKRMDEAMGGVDILGLKMPFRGSAIPYTQGKIRDHLGEIEADCHSYVNTYANDVRAFAARSQDNREPKVLANEMLRLSRHIPMAVERKIRVLDTSGRYIYKDGKTVNYSVSTNFSLSNSLGVNRGNKVDPLESVEKAIGVAAGVAGIATGGVGGAGIAVAGSIFGAVVGMFNFNWGMTDSLSESNGTSVSEGATLATQISTLDIELEKWEKCVVVKWEPEFFVNSLKRLGDMEGYDSYYRPELDIRGLGYMMCSGEEATEDDLNPGEKVRVREHYYYLTQIFNEGDMQDPQSLANHPWMLTLRGARDFTVFQQALKLPNDQNVQWGMGFDLMKEDIVSLLTNWTTPRYNKEASLMVTEATEINKSLVMLSKAYARALPTFPSLFTYSDSADDEVSDWNDEKASSDEGN